MIARLGRAARHCGFVFAALILAAGPHGTVLLHDAAHWVLDYDHVQPHEDGDHDHPAPAKHAHEVRSMPSLPFLTSAAPQLEPTILAFVALAVQAPSTLQPGNESADFWRSLDPPPRLTPSSFPPAFATAPPVA